MPVSRTKRSSAAGLLLAALCLPVAACGTSVTSPSVPLSAAPTVGAVPSASLAVVSAEPSEAPTSDPPSLSPSPSASPTSVPTPAPTATAATPTATARRTPTPASTRPPTPAPTRTARPTINPTPKPTLKPTAKPTVPPTPTPVTLAIEARDFLFSPASLSAPAGTPLRIAFTNQDEAIPHNVTVSSAAGAMLFNGQRFNGIATVTYQVPALAPGSYRLGCIVHPAMTGSLTVN